MSVTFLSPRLSVHEALEPRENENASSARPAKDPLASPPLTELEANLATALPRRPAHETWKVAGAPVVSSSPAGHLTGLLEKDPSAVPLVIWTEGSLAVHPDNRAFMLERPLPPPEDVSGGESEILAENEQLIEPGADPEKWRALGTAEAGVTVVNTPAAASSAAAIVIQTRVIQTRRGTIALVGTPGRSLTKTPSRSRTTRADLGSRPPQVRTPFWAG